MKKLVLLSFLLYSLVISAFGQVNSFQKYTIDCQSSGLQVALDFNTDKLIQDKLLFANGMDSARFVFSFLTVDHGYFAVHIRHPSYGNLYWKVNEDREITLSSHYSDPEHHFRLVYEKSKDAYYIESRKFKGQVLDVFGNSKQVGAKITLYGKVGSPNQFFKIVRFEDPEVNVLFEAKTGTCTEKIATTLGRGKVHTTEVPNAPKYDSIYVKDTSSWFVYVNDTIGQKGQWESDFITLTNNAGGCSTSGGNEIYLDGRFLRAFGSIELDEVVKEIMSNYYPNRDAQGNYKPLKKGGAHLITIKSKTGRTFYMPIAIVDVPFISGVLGTTTTPEVPKFILHDPPGDGSFATLSQDEEVCYGEASSLQTDNGGEFEISARIGVQGSMGLIVETEYEAYAEVSAGLEMGARINEDFTMETCLKATQEYNTSSDDRVIGSSGDLYIGISQEIAYGIQGVLGYNYGEDRFFYNEPQFVTVPIKTNTQFIWTESYLLERISEEIDNYLDSTKTDIERETAYDQALLMANFYSINVTNKSVAELIYNRTFDAASGPLTVSEALSTSETASYSSAMYINANAAVEIGAYIGGSGGSGKAKVFMNHEIGESNSSSKTITNTISYTIDDDDEETDVINVLIKEDPVFGTPIFELDAANSRTSCPYEGGYQIDQPDLSIKVEGASSYTDTAVSTGVDADKIASFRLRIENKSDFARDYVLKSDATYITESTRITLNGTTLHTNGDQTLYSLEPGQVVEPLIDVFKGNPNTTNHHGPIPLILSSDCDGNHDIESVVWLEVFFEDVTSVYNQTNPQLAFDLFPNPADDNVVFQFDKLKASSKIQIFNLMGHLVYSKELKVGQEAHKFSVENWKPGLYNAKMSNDLGFNINRLIVK